MSILQLKLSENVNTAKICESIISKTIFQKRQFYFAQCLTMHSIY